MGNRTRSRLALLGWLAIVAVGCSSAPVPTPSSVSTSPTAVGPSGSPSDIPTTGPTGTLRPDRSSRPRPSVTPSLEPGSTPGPTDAPPPLGGPLPACRYLDVIASGDPDTDWATMVIDTIYRLPSGFVPRRLVSTGRAGINGGLRVIPGVIPDLRALHEASIAAGAEVAVRWGYRTYAQQVYVFEYWADRVGPFRARKYSARPGHSEHMLGTAIDFRSADDQTPPWGYTDWGNTKPGRWMAANGWRYGFILSYPRGKSRETCYGYEPWHWRYIGRDLARQVHDSGQTLRRFLWDARAARQP